MTERPLTDYAIHSGRKKKVHFFFSLSYPPRACFALLSLALLSLCANPICNFPLKVSLGLNFRVESREKKENNWKKGFAILMSVSLPLS